MATSPRTEFMICVVQDGQTRTLCRDIEDLDAAVAVAIAMAVGRPLGLEGMMIRCESTRESWVVADLAAELAGTLKPPSVPPSAA